MSQQTDEAVRILKEQVARLEEDVKMLKRGYQELGEVMMEISRMIPEPKKKAA